MDNLQLLLASLLVLIICLIVYFNNAINRVKQPQILKWVGLLSVAISIYFYANLDRSHMESIWGVSGGAFGDRDDEIVYGGNDDVDGGECLIVPIGTPS